MLDKVRDYVFKWHMLQKEDGVIAGVSGGADSVCLLFVLLELQKEIGFRLIVAHVNHGIRGNAADEDEKYVRELCEKFAIPFECSFENVELIAKKRKQSTEEVGREVRKAFFEEMRLKHQCTKIALAHHQDDSAETLLLNLARGTGIKGLGGISPVNGTYIRPLLCLRREEIETYLESRGIAYCIDETNQSDMYTRNRIRNHVLPYLEEEINPKAIMHMNETMEQLRQIQKFLEELTEQHLEKAIANEENGYLILQEEYRKVPSVLQSYLLKRILVLTGGKEKDLETVHIQSIHELFEKQVGRTIDLPYQMRARRVYQGIKVERKGRPPEVLKEEVFFKLTDEKGDFTWGTRKIQCKVSEVSKEDEKKSKINAETSEKSVTKCFDCDIIKNNICFRTRQAGDYITIHPEGRTQKLKAYFINEKIPKEEREKILLVADGHHILWIVGYRTGAVQPIKGQTQRILEIRIDEGENHGRKN